jgi:hypothetical protein
VTQGVRADFMGVAEIGLQQASERAIPGTLMVCCLGFRRWQVIPESAS